MLAIIVISFLIQDCSEKFFFSCVSLKYRGFPLLLVNIAVRKGAMLFTVILDLSPFQYFIDSGTCLSDLFHIVCSAVPTVVWC